MTEETPPQLPISETLKKTEVVFAICRHGNSRSKQIALALDQLGYHRARTIGIQDLQRGSLDPDIERELHTAQVVVCAKSDIVADLRHYLKHHHLPDKVMIDLDMSEEQHQVARRQTINGEIKALRARLVEQLQNVGF